MHLEQILGKAVSRRQALKASAAAMLASQAAVIDQFVMTPQRPAYAAPNFSDIQFNIGASGEDYLVSILFQYSQDEQTLHLLKMTVLGFDLG